MEKRRSQRLACRLQVTFWKEGEEGAPRRGTTKDLSTTGMFVSTRMPHPPGTRITVRAGDPPVDLVAEVVHYVGILHTPAATTGEEDEEFVATAAQVDENGWMEAVGPVLHRLRPSGMGVRFLTPLENLAGLGLEVELSET